MTTSIRHEDLSDRLLDLVGPALLLPPDERLQLLRIMEESLTDHHLEYERSVIADAERICHAIDRGEHPVYSLEETMAMVREATSNSPVPHG